MGLEDRLDPFDVFGCGELPDLERRSCCRSSANVTVRWDMGRCGTQPRRVDQRGSRDGLFEFFGRFPCNIGPI